jgi:hypothetical protein
MELNVILWKIIKRIEKYRTEEEVIIQTLGDADKTL